MLQQGKNQETLDKAKTQQQDGWVGQTLRHRICTSRNETAPQTGVYDAPAIMHEN